MNNHDDETIPATIERLLAKQRNDEDPPPTAPGQARIPLGLDYSPLELSFGSM